MEFAITIVLIVVFTVIAGIAIIRAQRRGDQKTVRRLQTLTYTFYALYALWKFVQIGNANFRIIVIITTLLLIGFIALINRCNRLCNERRHRS